MSVGNDPDELVLHTDGGDHAVKLFAEASPAKIPWGDVGARGVAECTGVFRQRAAGGKPGYDSHLDGGAQCVALSAPAKDDVLTVVFGVHQTPLQGQPMLSGASCTSGSIAFPLRALLDHKQEWGFCAGAIQTVHAYTAGEQGLQDRPAPITPGGRRMYAAGTNIIPTTTGAAKAIPKVDGIGDDMAGIPFDGFALRVPVVSGSVTLLQTVLQREPALDEVLNCFRSKAEQWQGKFAVNEDPIKNPAGLPLVSTHIIKRPESSILDVEYCSKLGPLYTFALWYGNEWGYVLRLVEALSEQVG